jgi:hypothetical protein
LSFLGGEGEGSDQGVKVEFWEREKGAEVGCRVVVVPTGVRPQKRPPCNPVGGCDKTTTSIRLVRARGGSSLLRGRVVGVDDDRLRGAGREGRG